MNNLMTTTTTSTNFFDIVSDLELDPSFPDQWQRRGVEWARFADWQRSIGFRISIGSPT